MKNISITAFHICLIIGVVIFSMFIALDCKELWVGNKVEVVTILKDETIKTGCEVGIIEHIPGSDSVMMIHTRKRIYAVSAEIRVEKDRIFEPIRNLPGVVEVIVVSPYQIDIYKGEAFSWKEISPDVIKLIKSALYKDIQIGSF